MNLKNFIYVSAAFFPIKRKLLVVQRPENKKDPLKWELPGGKLQVNESFDESLIREIKEELDINISVIQEIGNVEIERENSILIITFILIEGDSSQIKLLEHNDIKFVNYEELSHLDLCEADNIFIKNYEIDIKKFID